MAATLTPDQIAIVKATVPVLKEHGAHITTVFYDNMIRENPELRNIFSITSQATGRQPRALAGAVLAYATYADDLGKLTRAVERIAHKHVSLQVTAAQYDIVGKYLIQAIGQVLGDAATAEIVDAWTAAYSVLAGAFIGVEGQMYKENETKDHWVGWRKFRILRKVPESNGITSFYLAPSDGGTPLPKFLPGQYISLQVFVPQLGHLQSRQYSLSEGPKEKGEYYRISVKKDEGEVPGIPGIISNMLHANFNEGDEVELSHPQGEFFVNPQDATKEGVPVVLVSVGVGATPLVSILDSLVSAKGAVKRPVSWIHSSRSSNAQPFGDVVRRICRENEHVSAHIFLRTLGPEDQAGVTYDFGDMRLDLSKLDRDQDLFLGDSRTEYYICGPEAFMIDVRHILRGMGVDKERVHLELFATGDVADE
ncbi:putative flavohemo protein [Diplogelasinospora grovesii]|uniref:nitric oxide dioxygenase n=1 Tax=Diplogelasinospora grovesii TaxID=303347 RepID=A0AAN6N2E8_9PEZI|nr:putative flavohemo protein [Diplogelasinospora grovesii]